MGSGQDVPPQLGGGVWGEGSPLTRKKGNFAFIRGAFWRIFFASWCGGCLDDVNPKLQLVSR